MEPICIVGLSTLGVSLIVNIVQSFKRDREKAYDLEHRKEMNNVSEGRLKAYKRECKESANLQRELNGEQGTSKIRFDEYELIIKDLKKKLADKDLCFRDRDEKVDTLKEMLREEQKRLKDLKSIITTHARHTETFFTQALDIDARSPECSSPPSDQEMRRSLSWGKLQELMKSGKDFRSWEQVEDYLKQSSSKKE